MARRGPADPKTPFEKANDLLEQARDESDPKIRALRIEAARRYYMMDTNPGGSNAPAVLGALVATWVVIVVVVVAAFYLLGIVAGGLAVIGSFALLSLLMGAYLRTLGLISERTLLGLAREGFKALFFLRAPDGGGTAPRH